MFCIIYNFQFTHLLLLFKMTPRLNVKFIDFKNYTNNIFGNLREDKDFADVTLACGDGEQVDAHKVILAATSPFFQNLLKRNRHPHPWIYMRGIKSENLLAIVDFLYSGEAYVYQENLDSFLAIAEELGLQGLMGEQERDPTPMKKSPNPTVKREQSNQNAGQNNSSLENAPSSPELGKERKMPISNLSGDLQELDEKVKTMMEKSQNRTLEGTRLKAHICKLCGKEGQVTAIRDHIEFNHLEGISLSCNVCGKECRSRLILRRHKCSTN